MTDRANLLTVEKEDDELCSGIIPVIFVDVEEEEETKPSMRMPAIPPKPVTPTEILALAHEVKSGHCRSYVDASRVLSAWIIEVSK